MTVTKPLITGTNKAAWFAAQLDREHLTALLNMLLPNEREQLKSALKQPLKLPANICSGLRQEIGQAVQNRPFLSENAGKIAAGFIAEGDVERLVKAGCKSSDRDIWFKLNHLDATALAQYLSNESPAIVAFVIGRMDNRQSAEVLACLPERIAAEIIGRVAVAAPIRPEVEKNIEAALEKDLPVLQNGAGTGGQTRVMEIFGAFDRAAEARILDALEDCMPETAEQIRRNLFKFEDLLQLSDPEMQKLLRHIEKDRLGAALRGASDLLKNRFFANMPPISEKVIREDMEKAGPIKISEVENAQYEIITIVKNLAKAGQIVLKQS